MMGIACGLLFLVSLAPAADIQSSLDAFASKAPGVVAIVGTIDRGTEHIYSAGKPPVGAPALDENTEFQIGSITKTFTATLLAQMVETGEVKLDDPIGALLPANVHAPTFNGAPVTLLNLAEQNSGFPALPNNFEPVSWDDPYAGYDTNELYGFLNAYHLTRAPGAAYEYSNLGVGLLGTLLGNAAHSDYPSLLNARILSPLGMHDTSAVLTSATRAKMMPGFTKFMAPATPWSFAALAGCGAIDSTMHDMLAYLRANLDAPNGTLGKAMAFAHSPRADAASGMKIGLVWQTAPRSGIVWHNGETGGYHSYIAFDPASGAGVVVLTNVASFDVDTLGVHIIAPSVTNAPVFGSPFAGFYALSPSFTIGVYEENGRLYEQATSQGANVLTLVSGTTYAVHGVDATVTFEEDAAGNVTGLVLHQNGVDRRAPRAPSVRSL